MRINQDLYEQHIKTYQEKEKNQKTPRDVLAKNIRAFMTMGAKGLDKDHKGTRNGDIRFRRAGNEFSLEAMTASQVAVKRNQGF